jgi:hypothetical protein
MARVTTYAGGTGPLPVGMTPGDADGQGATFWVRTVLAAAVALVAVGLLTLAGVLAVFAVVVASPTQPGRSIAAMLSVPELRQDAAESLVADVEDERGSVFAPATRQILVTATDEALGDPAVLDAMAALRYDDGRLDAVPYVAAIADELGAQATSTEDPQARRVLSTFADELPVLVETSVRGEAQADVLDLSAGLAEVRRYGLVAAGVLAGLGLVALLVAAAIAVHRGATAVIGVSCALVATAVVLAPGEWLLDRVGGVGGALARVAAAAGGLAGSGLVWTLLLASLVPPLSWWAIRSARRTA